MVQIEIKRDVTTIRFRNTPAFEEILDIIRSCESAKFDSSNKSWTVLTAEIRDKIDEITKLDPETRVLEVWGLIEDPKTREIRNDDRLYPYQKEGVAWLRGVRKGILADEMGLGKTAQTILAADIPALVFCPSFLVRQWEKEVKRWLGENTKICAIRGDNNKDEIEQADFYIVGYGLVSNNKAYSKFKKLIPLLEERIRYRGTIILDEGHYLKNRQAQRTKRIMDLINETKPARVYVATGTPMTNKDPDEIYSLLKICGFSFPASRFSKIFRVFEEVKVGKQVFYRFSHARRLPLLREVLKNYVLRRTVSDVIQQLPPVRWSVIELDINRDVEKLYNRDEVKTLQETLFNNNFTITPELQKHVVFFRREISERKIPETVEIAQDILENEDRVLIFVDFKDTARALAEKLGGEYITSDVSTQARAEKIEKIKENGGVLIGTIGAIGVGLNLDFIKTCIVHDWPWSPAALSQAIKRIHRVTTTSSPHVVLPVFEGLEYKIWKKLHEKTTTFKRTLGELDSTGLSNVVKTLANEDDEDDVSVMS